jgi:hypothetical protein
VTRFGAGFALVFVAVVSLVVSACGTAPTDIGFPATMYSTREYGFSIQYPSDFAKIEVSRDSSDPAAPLFQIFFADPAGTRIKGKSVDTLEVAVYEMTAAPTDTDFAQHKKDFEGMLVGLIGKLPRLKLAEGPSWTRVDGRPAVSETYTYRVSGQDVAVSAELVFNEAQAYLVRAQAGRAVWPTTGRKLVSSMATFAFL